MILYAGLPDYWSDKVGLYGLRGFYIIIHSDADYPYNLTPSPILVSSGLGTQISLSRSVYKQFNEWPYTYSECRVNEQKELMGPPLQDPSLFEQVIATNFSYSRSTCILFCAQLETTKTCGCNNYNIPNPVTGYSFCISPSQKKCSQKFFYSTFINGDFIKENCLPKCPLECTQHELKTSFSYYQYPTRAQAVAWSHQYPELRAKFANQTDFLYAFELEPNLVRVSLYFDTFSFTLSEEKAAMSLEDLVGVLGGHLHLFLGMSLLSFVELIEISIIGLRIAFQ